MIAPSVATGAALMLLLGISVVHAQTTEKAERVSLIQLIANPERYEGKLVSVVGFVHIEFEGNAVWLHKDDFENRIYANSIWVHVSKCIDPSGKPMSDYASLAGRFTAQRRGHLGLWQGELAQVGECFPVPKAKGGA